MIPSIWEPYNKQIRLEYIMDGGMHKGYNKVSNYKMKNVFPSQRQREILHAASVHAVLTLHHDAVACASFYAFLSLLQTVQTCMLSAAFACVADCDGVIPPMNSMWL